ncbi:MAG: PEP-CTERM sorting domain-containing protein, partial [Verrucomicrobia bacterium]|nr:PEP-CTERM sorting domain-containing protein [Verrucomicrobiota bacterium]
TFGIEVWGLNAASVPPGINLDPSPGSGVAAYSALQADGFTLQATFAGWPMISGRFGGRSVILPTIPGPEAVLALAVWNTSAPSWAAMLGGADSDTRAGVIAFVNPVTVTIVNPAGPASLTGWTSDLVLTTIPEPSVLTLVSLGGAALLLVRHRR